MLNLFDAIDFFELRILDDNPGTKCFIDGDVDVAVNRGGNDEASMLPVIGWKIGAAAAETDSQRTPRDDHRADLEERQSGPHSWEKAGLAADKCPHSAQSAFAEVINAEAIIV